MRTNIDIPEQLLAEAKRRSYGERLRALEDKTASLSLRHSPTEVIRADRDRA